MCELTLPRENLKYVMCGYEKCKSIEASGAPIMWNAWMCRNTGCSTATFRQRVLFKINAMFGVDVFRGEKCQHRWNFDFCAMLCESIFSWKIKPKIYLLFTCTWCHQNSLPHQIIDEKRISREWLQNVKTSKTPTLFVDLRRGAINHKLWHKSWLN